MNNSSKLSAAMISFLLPFLMWPGFVIAEPPTAEDWKTSFIVGRFYDSELSEPDQIFRIEYGVTNGTAHGIAMPGSVRFNLSNTDSASLIVKFPRNFPYHNDLQSAPASNFVFFNGSEPVSGTSVTAADCFFVFSVPFNGIAYINMTWAFILNGSPVRGDEVPASCVPQTLVEGVSLKKDGTIRPMVQIRAGVDPHGILCPEGLDVFMSPKPKPYCVDDRLREILYQRWFVN